MSVVSVIIPIYNSQDYLRKCLTSVCNQTLRDIEIVCVNDGSTDDSLKILKEYAAADSRIKVISKENGGLVSARKIGVAAARGQYIGYVDSDDWIEPDMYERLYRTATEKEVDLVTCGYYLEGNYITEHLDTVEEGLYDGESVNELRDNTIYKWDKRETGLRGCLCCKLFKREIVQEAQMKIPDEISIAEDKMCLLTAILECASVYVLRVPLYHWVIHPTSMSHKNSINTCYLMKINEVYKYLTSLYNHKNFTNTMRNQAEVYIVELLTLGINSRMGFKNKNLLRIDPYWLNDIPTNAKIITYGGGDLLEQYKIQLKQRSDIHVIKDLGFDFPEKEELDGCKYDYILITIKNKSKADSVKNEFISLGIETERILWFEQPEFYWKYAKAQGLLEGE